MRPRLRVIFGLAGALFLFLFPAQPSCAQNSGGAQVLQLDPSIRASGMGHASGAVFWGLDRDHWANPALLGYERGIRFEHGRTKLSPDNSELEYTFATDRITFGARGVGIFLTGFPVDGLGRTRLDYGESTATDESGVELGTFDSWESTQSAGIGVSLSELILGSSPTRSGLAARLARAGDLAFGLTLNRVSVQLAPLEFSDLGGTGKGTGLDGGVVLRLTPYDSIDSLGWFRPVDGWLDPICGGFRFDASAGCSDLSFNSSKIKFSNGDSDPMPSYYRLSAAARLAMGFPGIGRDWLRDQGAGLLARALTPLIQFGAAWDRTKGMVFEDETPIYDRGWELTVANIYSIRRGHINDPAGGINDNSSGWGLGIRLGEYGGFRYDEATMPLKWVRGEKVCRKGWTAQIDPLAIWRDLRR